MPDLPDAQGLNEIQAAARAGFARFRDFQRARKLGLFPRPLHDLPGVGPVWSTAQVERFLGTGPRRSGKEEAMRRLNAQASA